MAGRGVGSWFDSDTGSLLMGLGLAALGIGTVVGVAYQAGTDVSERILRQQRKCERKFNKKEKVEQKERKKEERHRRRLEWWEAITSRRYKDRDED